MSNEASQRLPISVLTGFLGSGKTTVLNHLIRQPALSRTLVLINEFGKIGLDHSLVVSSDDDAVIEMSSGCICCTFRADLVKTLRDAPWRFSRSGVPWFERVVIETTGIADPAPILHTVMSDSAVVERYCLDGVISTVDSVNGDSTLDRHIECVKQVAVADRLLLTKTDLADSDRLGVLQERLHDLNPAAPQIVADNGRVDPARLFDVGVYSPDTKSTEVQNWLRSEAYDTVPGSSARPNEAPRHDERIRSASFTIDKPVRREAFDAWLETLLRFDAASLLRIKGLINIAGLDAPMVVHGVQHVIHPPLILESWPSDDRRTRIVFITHGIDESELKATIRLLEDATYGVSGALPV